MIQEHIKLLRLLSEIGEKQQTDFFITKTLLNKFREAVQRHFFQEETIIFERVIKVRGKKDLIRLIKEHKEINELIDKIEKDIDFNLSPKIDNLKIVFINHSRFETETFYPRLDKELNNKIKIRLS